jgi:cytochrome c peroxidase
MRATTGALVLFVAAALAACGSSASAPPACDLDPSLTADECTTVKGMALTADLPLSNGNAKADDFDTAAMGFQIFFDARFSSNQNVRCATCHLPEQKFADGKPYSTGLEDVTRNSPTALNAARMHVYFWDGRADSLWSQPLFAFENPKEMGFTRLEIAHRVKQSYASTYEAVFGPLPPLDDTTRFPAAGKPGDAAFDQMAPADQDAINRLVSNVGKSLEAYERKIAASRAPFDRFVAGDQSQLSASQRRGMIAFLRNNCTDCHSGSMMSDEKFHNLGVPAWPGTDPDRGRIDGIATLDANIFNATGPYADAPIETALPVASDADLGAIRTPSLRNVAITAPYAHNGRYAALADVIAFHAAGGGHGNDGYVGVVDPLLVPRNLSDGDVADIADFLSAMTGDYPPAPWNDWPQK